MVSYLFELIEDEQHHYFLPKIIIQTHGLKTISLFNSVFFGSGDYQLLTELRNKLEG